MRVHAYAMGLSVVLFASAAAFAATYHAYPGDNLQTAIESLSYGDTLIVHSVGGDGTGRYDHFRVYNLRGDNPRTPDNEWITVQAADGEPRPVIYGGSYNLYNLVEFRDYIGYAKIIGLEFDGGSDSIKLPGTSGDHVIFEDLYMHNIGNTGINLSSCGNVSFMEIRGCEITDTGYAGNGEGMYLGTHGYQGTGAGILRDSIIEYNYVHHCYGSQGDGIEVKYECYRNIVRDNVIHDTQYPGILSHGTARPTAADNNILTRNVIWNSGDNGIQTHQTTTIVNNVVFSSSRCINVGENTSNSGILHDIYVYNNTFYSASSRTAGFYVSGKTNVEICNNLFYQPSAGSLAVTFDGTVGIVSSGNYYYGTTQNLPGGFTAGPAPADAFINSSTTPGVIDLYLQGGTALENAGDNTYAPADDFNETSRPQDGTAEPGAYEIVGASNPGWQIDEEFKTRLVQPALVSSEPPADGTLPKTQNNVILLTFDAPVTLPAGDALVIVEMGGGPDVSSAFAYQLDPNDPNGLTLKATESGAQLTNLTWYQVSPAAGLAVDPFTLDVCALFGDANDSARVTTADYSEVKAHMGEYTDARYDLDGSGRITTADYSVVKAHMGDRAPTKP